ncbi:MAG: Na+/H+ antiporter subunit C [Acidobacteriota bacterium]|nr:MAG: Na+/H+ antiporter subunit C [Acidobacteriota bacterium]
MLLFSVFLLLRGHNEPGGGFIGGLYAAAVYMMLRRSLVKLIFGLIMLGHASNLLIFTAGRLVRSQSPIIARGETMPTVPFADPVPQALILTAIVISFGVQAFAIVLLKRAYKTAGTDDLDELKSTDS